MDQNTTPTVRCPRCDHSINSHAENDVCKVCLACNVDPNLIAVALLFGDLTPTPSTRISRQSDGSWS